MASDPYLRHFIEEKQAEVRQVSSDYGALASALKKEGWSPKDTYNPDTMPAVLAAAPGLTDRAKRSLKSQLFARFAREQIRVGNRLPSATQSRATSLDWNVLDLFYQLGGFEHFKKMFDLAERGKNEGPICNLSLISQYLARFLDFYPFPISGESLSSEQFLRNFANYLYTLFRRGEANMKMLTTHSQRAAFPS